MTLFSRDEILPLVQNLRQNLEQASQAGVRVLPGRKGESSPEVKDSFVLPPQLADLTLSQLREKALSCEQCSLCQTRTQVVFGLGNPKADLMFVGEAPGRDEDLQGKPFVGRAGQLLTKIIEAMGFSREEVYIANVLKCRPPNNRPPKPEEIFQCEPYLMAQIVHIQPKVIVALGSFAAQTLLQTDRKISGLRGVFHDYHGVPLMPTYHPAYLLRSPSEKKSVWEDMKVVMKALNKTLPKTK